MNAPARNASVNTRAAPDRIHATRRVDLASMSWFLLVLDLVRQPAPWLDRSPIHVADSAVCDRETPIHDENPVPVCYRRTLGDFFLFHQSKVAAHVQAQVPGEESRHPLDVQRPVGEVRTGVRRALDD